jgi:hypothetical protein
MNALAWKNCPTCNGEGVVYEARSQTDPQYLPASNRISDDEVDEMNMDVPESIRMPHHQPVIPCPTCAAVEREVAAAIQEARQSWRSRTGLIASVNAAMELAWDEGHATGYKTGDPYAPNPYRVTKGVTT